jgi:hypothetical protein
MFTVVSIETPKPPPAWALLQRQLIAAMNRAGEEFVRVYAKQDGTLRFKERYEGGMNSSDDAYEAFRGMSLHAIIGGHMELDRLHRHVWDGITQQFTRYGQIYREFDSNWDWMHHGEGYTSFYTLGLARPDDAKFRDRAIRFANMYTGGDSESPNYDPEHNIIRAVMNGSRGPKMTWNTRDWIPTNANLTYYHLPYDDIPGVKSPAGWINDDQFAVIVKTMSDRMARGDVPINLTVTPLIANAWLYTGDEKYKRWILRYVEGWEERTRANNGITPDNVGLNGKPGEYTNGNWWGGYYGWKWPRGGLDIVRAELTAARVAQLLTGDARWLDLPRSQLEVMRKQGRMENGRFVVPARYGEKGWHLFGPEAAYPWVWLWLQSFDAKDLEHAERIANGPDAEWLAFLQGKSPAYPEQAFKRDLAQVRAKVQAILNEHGDPETWVDSKWAGMDPLPMDNLVRLTMGAPPVDLRGEMLHARVRYFDAEQKRPGLPEGVAVLVTALRADGADIEFVNTNVFDRRRVLVAAGAYGEHQIVKANGREVNAPTVEVDLAPGASGKVMLEMKRYANQPRFAWPF